MSPPPKRNERVEKVTKEQAKGRRSPEERKSTPSPSAPKKQKMDPQPSGGLKMTLEMFRSVKWDDLISEEKASTKRISELEKKGKEDAAKNQELLNEIDELKEKLARANSQSEKNEQDAKGKASALKLIRERERKLNEALTQALGDKLNAKQAASQLKEDLAQEKKKTEEAVSAQKEELTQVKNQLEEKEKLLVASEGREEVLLDSVDNLRRQLKLDTTYKQMAGERRSFREGEGKGPPAKQPKVDDQGKKEQAK